MILFERHVFGSTNGYRTLAASPGLTETDCRAIELSQFGTPDQKYVQSLAAEPAYLSRPLDRHRRVITRVLPGTPDDVGRITLRFVSVVISNSDWNAICRNALGILPIDSLWAWNGDKCLTAARLETTTIKTRAINRSRVSSLLQLLSEVEVHSNNREPVRVSEVDYSLEDIAFIEPLLPPPIAENFATGHRVLNAALPLSLMTLTREVARTSQFPLAKQTRNLSPYAQTLAAAGLPRGKVPMQVVERYELFGLGASSVLGDTQSTTLHRLAEPTSPLERSPLSARRGTSRLRTESILLAVTFVSVALGAFGLASYMLRPKPDVPSVLFLEALNTPIDIAQFDSYFGALEQSIGSQESLDSATKSKALELLRNNRSSYAREAARRIAIGKESERTYKEMGKNQSECFEKWRRLSAALDALGLALARSEGRGCALEEIRNTYGDLEVIENLIRRLLLEDAATAQESTQPATFKDASPISEEPLQ